MSEIYNFKEGNLPLLISIPHDGCRLPGLMQQQMTPVGLTLPDTDWHVNRLYNFAADMGASVLSANFSRYVVDLNRPDSDEELYPGQLSTGVCPTHSFSGDALYLEDSEPVDQDSRIRLFWRPYHDKLIATLQLMHLQHGYAMLWDAHSIPSVVPSLFDGELPELNIGTWDGRSCERRIQNAIHDVAKNSDWSYDLNGRFKGGFITRHYGKPSANINAVQLEIAQRCYMDELTGEYDPEKAGRLRDTLRKMLETFVHESKPN